MIICITGFCASQEQSLLKAKALIQAQEFDLAESLLDSITVPENVYLKGEYFFQYGLLYRNKDKHDLGFKNLLKAENLFHQCDSLKREAYTNYEIFILLSHQANAKVNSYPYLVEFDNYAAVSQIPVDLARANSAIAQTHLDNDDFDEAMICYRLTLKNLNDIPDELTRKIKVSATEMNIGTTYRTVKMDPDSALVYYNKSLKVFEEIGLSGLTHINYNNQVLAYDDKGDYQTAYEIGKKIELNIEDFPKKTRLVYYKNLMSNYEKRGKLKDALDISKRIDTLREKINNNEQDIAISNFKEQYDNEKLRAEKAEAEAQRLAIEVKQKDTETKRKQNQNIAIGLAGTLTLGAVIAFLFFKNTKRKQKLAEQEKELETQKLATVLKEQELTAIDAMIEGQEKERQRIANDLHDDLGGLMATVKLHFNALKEKQTPELYTKTNQLIDEAYEKVRTVAHAKNSGVIAKQGLLKAINEMADNISASNTIKIDVLDHGLENRLENSLELTIFRIIQELITNIIKHAEATEATIHITNHEDSLNIMVEDNGKGFNPSQITKTNKGMGISSIDKRVEHLDGSMTIESEITKGTTVIIDIPL